MKSKDKSINQSIDRFNRLISGLQQSIVEPLPWRAGLRLQSQSSDDNGSDQSDRCANGTGSVGTGR